MPNFEEVLRAKQVLSQRYLRPEMGPSFAASVVTNRFLNVADAVAAAHRNVHAVGVGGKIVQGKLTSTLCVRLYVVNKLAPSLLSAFSMLPKEQNGIPTDVIETPFAYIGARQKNRGLPNNNGLWRQQRLMAVPRTGKPNSVRSSLVSAQPIFR